MNKFIFITVAALALVTSVRCGSYGSGCSNSAGSAYNVNSYSLGAGNAASAYSSPAYAPPAYSPSVSPAYNSAPKYSVQPLYARELYPGQQNYRSYQSAPTYSQVVLPIVPSAPVAKLYVPAQQSYAAPAGSYSSAY